MIDKKTGRLSVQTVRRLHRLLEGDPEQEGAILDFIRGKWQAKTLFDLPENVARSIMDRPWDFKKAANAWCAENY